MRLGTQAIEGSRKQASRHIAATWRRCFPSSIFDHTSKGAEIFFGEAIGTGLAWPKTGDYGVGKGSVWLAITDFELSH